MSEQDYLQFIEAVATTTDFLQKLREELIEKGWSPHGAEQAAMLIFAKS